MPGSGGLWAKVRSARLLLPGLFALAALALLVGLGSWQLARKSWKDDLVARIAARGAAPPIGVEALSALSCAPEGVPDPEMSCQFLPVRLAGVFDHGRERHVYGLHALSPGRPSVAGYFVMTPFRLTGADTVLVVNRGFVPEDRKAPETRHEGQVAGPVEITGLLRRAQPRVRFDAGDNAARNVYFVRSPVELGLVTETPQAGRPLFAIGPGSSAVFYVDLAAPTPPGDWPRPAPGPPPLVNRHLEYALTWYGLALTLIGVFAAFARSRVHA